MTRPQPKGERPLRILLVEDDPNDQMLFRAVARRTRLGLQTHWVADGHQAVKYLEGRGGALPDLMVLDLRLPGMDGFEVLAWCQASPLVRKLPVVILSGALDDQWEAQALSMGAARFFLKPSRLQDWVRLIHEIAQFAGSSVRAVPTPGKPGPAGAGLSCNTAVEPLICANRQ